MTKFIELLDTTDYPFSLNLQYLISFEKDDDSEGCKLIINAMYKDEFTVKYCKNSYREIQDMIKN